MVKYGEDNFKVTIEVQDLDDFNPSTASEDKQLFAILGMYSITLLESWTRLKDIFSKMLDQSWPPVVSLYGSGLDSPGKKEVEKNTVKYFLKSKAHSSVSEINCLDPLSVENAIIKTIKYVQRALDEQPGQKFIFEIFYT